MDEIDSVVSFAPSEISLASNVIVDFCQINASCSLLTANSNALMSILSLAMVFCSVLTTFTGSVAKCHVSSLTSVTGEQVLGS